MIKVEANDAEVLRVFGRVVSAVKQPQPLLAAIGEVLIDSTKQRFQTGTGPDGTRWPDNSPVTLLEYLRRFDGIHEKTGKRIGTKDGYYIKRGADAGRLTKKSAAMLAAKRPLIGETRLLSHIIGYKVAGHSVQVGTPFCTVPCFSSAAKNHSSLICGAIFQLGRSLAFLPMTAIASWSRYGNSSS
ncbi:MAG: phage virion morphogenesis protein [Thiobacillus sp.]|nr:MAG: phage virion morphogenesis protein [Thiobacillus sp.]